MQLVEKGLIGLDDPLDKLMPEMTSNPTLTVAGEFVDAKKAITFRHLLIYTAGFGCDFLDYQLQSSIDLDGNMMIHQDYLKLAIWYQYKLGRKNCRKNKRSRPRIILAEDANEQAILD